MAASVLAIALALLAIAAPAPAWAGATSFIKYDLSVAGVPVARFKFNGTHNAEGYTMYVVGKTKKYVRVIASFKGTTKSAGKVAAGRIEPASFTATYKTNKKTRGVTLQFAKGDVGNLALTPTLPPHPRAVPLTAEHRLGVVDPLSAIVMPLPEGELNGASVCDRRFPIFDGRRRYDLQFSYKRQQNMNVPGQGVANVYVCKVKYHPIAGHRTDQKSMKFVEDHDGIEIWLAPFANLGILVPTRAVLPTPVGTAVLTLDEIQISGAI